MVPLKLLKLRVEIDLNIPEDLIQNEKRLEMIEEGILKSISKGLYEEGISFHIISFNIKKIQFLQK